MNSQMPDRRHKRTFLWELVDAASRCPHHLGGSAELVERFLLHQFLPAGGCQGRDGHSDLYYTVFTLQGLAALGVRRPESGLENYLETFTGGSRLDLVHLACLARCHALMAREARPDASSLLNEPRDSAEGKIPDEMAGASNRPPSHISPDSSGHSPQFVHSILHRLSFFAAADGGYSPVPGAAHGTAYGLFLAMGIYEDLAQPLPDTAPWEKCLRGLRLPEGGWANQSGIPTATVPTATAAVHVLRHLGEPVPEATCPWLLQHAHPQGGFRATLQAPLPDLLSTAVVAHTLNLLGHDLRRVREPCLNFLDSLWTNTGGFHGNWADDLLDSEYTFYGLLALGSLTQSA